MKKLKKVWDQVSVQSESGGFAVLLDQNKLRTPAKAPLVVPTIELAQAIAFEWQNQPDHIDPLSMPMTRTANSAVDKLVPQRAEVADMLAAYGDADLLCYRAQSPAELVARQAVAWDPILDWAKVDLGAPMHVQTGVIHKAQDPQALARLSLQVHALDNFELAGFHDLVALSGSLIIALAVIHRFVSPEQGWAISRIDETWQIEQWGEDDEATLQDRMRQKSFFEAESFFRLCQIKP